MSLALSFLMVLADSGAVDREGNGAESVLQGFSFVFAQCKSLCNMPGASQPGLVVHPSEETCLDTLFLPFL